MVPKSGENSMHLLFCTYDFAEIENGMLLDFRRSYEWVITGWIRRDCCIDFGLISSIRNRAK